MLPPAKHPHPKWLADAIFYEIYPQSFVDSNGDGIGDIPGITLKLDYIKDLGCNAIWLNPCFDSPFKDAGYDVRDYKKVASRYGTNDDLIALFDAAHRRDMHVILDLVPGHTSDEPPLNHVLLVENSWVSGATVQSAAAMLHQIGAEHVTIYCLARIIDLRWTRRELGEQVSNGIMALRHETHWCPWTLQKHKP